MAIVKVSLNIKIQHDTVQGTHPLNFQSVDATRNNPSWRGTAELQTPGEAALLSISLSFQDAPSFPPNIK